jgi:hypothetical protein
MLIITCLREQISFSKAEIDNFDGGEVFFVH